jgi:hypothetical protein
MNAAKPTRNRALLLQLSLIPAFASIFIIAAATYHREERVLFHFKTDVRQWKIAKGESSNQYSLRFDSWRNVKSFYLGPLVVFWFGPPEREPLPGTKAANLR